MLEPSFNKYRAAIDVLQRGREALVEALAEEILDQADDLSSASYQFNEFLELQGTKLHFLTLLMSQLEQSADALDELRSVPPPKAPAKRKPRQKKLTQQSSKEGSTEDS